MNRRVTLRPPLDRSCSPSLHRGGAAAAAGRPIRAAASACGRRNPTGRSSCSCRLSRTLLGLLAGGALALAGALFQAMLRDALATPVHPRDLRRRVARRGRRDLVRMAADRRIACRMGDGAPAGPAYRARRRRRTAAAPVSSFSLLLSGLAANSVCSASSSSCYGSLARQVVLRSRGGSSAVSTRSTTRPRRLRRRGGDAAASSSEAGESGGT